jgi:hypothetical protein
VFIFSKQIFEAHKSKGEKFLNKFFQTVSSLRSGFKLDPVTGAPQFETGIGELRQPEYTLEQIFVWLESADKSCIVVVDEFQQITKYPERISRRSCEHISNGARTQPLCLLEASGT